MHRGGHHGVSLLGYAPVAALAAVYYPEFVLLAVLGAMCIVNPLWPIDYVSKRNVSFSLSMLPDLDMKLPGIKHRGITHTVWFAGIAAVGCGAVGAAVVPLVSVLVPASSDPVVVGGLFFGYLGFHSVVTHLLADMLTPMGVKPFAPLFDSRYSLGLVRADNSVANYLFFLLGVGAVVAAFLVPGRVSAVAGLVM